MAQRVFSKIQAGVEATAGTAVAADTILSLLAQELPTDRKPVFPVENLGVRVESSRAVIFQYLARYNLISQQAGIYYQALPLLFSMLLKGGVTPAEQTADQDDYLWDFTPDLTFGADNALDSITLEVGDDAQAYEIEYGLLSSLRLDGRVSQDDGSSPVTLRAPMFGRQVTATSFTGALSIPAQEHLNAKLARLYIDTAWAGVGGTEKANVLRGFSVDIIGGAHPKFAGSANKYFNTHDQGPISVMLALTLERGTISDAMWDDFQAGTFKVYRLAVNGSQIGTGDTHNLTIDVGGYIEEAIPLAAEDKGNNIDTFMIYGTYDVTGEKLCQVQVTTNVSAI